MRLKLFILLFCIVAIVISYFYAPLVYYTYLQLYYQKICKIDEVAFTNKVKDLYLSKQYDVLQQYLEHGAVLYPANKTIKKYNGLYLIDNGDVRGAFILIALDAIPDDANTLEKIITVLDDNKSYQELLMIVHKKGIKTATIEFLYGKALCATGIYHQALSHLKKAYTHGIVEADYYIGMCYHHLRDYNNALIWYKKALARKPGTVEYIKSIATVYQQKGDYTSSTKYIMRLQH